MSGTLYLCATPIGNLEDITLRVLRVLKEADLIAAEDTRNSRKLLNHFEIHTPLTSYHEYNRVEKAHELIDQLLAGKDIALITDAGTPGISDPGEVLAQFALEQGITVTSLPGASACVTALSVSGQSARRFAFEGFLPAEKKARRAVLEMLKEETRTIVLYESPHHLLKTLKDLLGELGERSVTICRELTKIHEEIRKSTLSDVINYYTDNEPRGEYVLVLAGADEKELLEKQQAQYQELAVAAHVAQYEAAGMDRKEAMKAAARDRGVGKREIYQALQERDQDE
ncbi:MAG: 16S rRNA (cytidine(1402)-2'-O)-methyltransferase [Lachnospiraceae bacterium]|nr:16S rRNA (cytidine(1402)-2'-O)-methyltransferase [Lachnospiraceae bacterium]